MNVTTHTQSIVNMIETCGNLMFNDEGVDWRDPELKDAVKGLSLTLEDMVALTEEEDEE